MTEFKYKVSMAWRTPNLHMGNRTVHWVVEILDDGKPQLWGIGKDEYCSARAPHWLQASRLGAPKFSQDNLFGVADRSLSKVIQRTCKVARFVDRFGKPTFHDLGPDVSVRDFHFPVRITPVPYLLDRLERYVDLTRGMDPGATGNPRGLDAMIVKSGTLMIPPRAVQVKGPARRAWMALFGHADAILVKS